jgi:hypothetical protein
MSLEGRTKVGKGERRRYTLVRLDPRHHTRGTSLIVYISTWKNLANTPVAQSPWPGQLKSHRESELPQAAKD